MPRQSTPLKHWSAEEVWAAACAAQRVNGDYVKYEQRDPENPAVVLKRPNRELMFGYLLDSSAVTNEDREQGRQVRQHFQGLLFRQLAGNINDFLQSAMKVAGRDEFTERDRLDLAITASLPKSAQRDIERQQIKDEHRELSRDSQHLGKIGDKFSGEVEVLNSVYSIKWATYYVNARKNTNLIMFAYRTELKRGDLIKIQGTVKAHRDDGTTQLNRVKVLK